MYARCRVLDSYLCVLLAWQAILFKRVPALVPESKIKNLNPHPPIQKYGPIRKEYEAWKDSLSSLREVSNTHTIYTHVPLLLFSLHFIT